MRSPAVSRALVLALCMFSSVLAACGKSKAPPPGAEPSPAGVSAAPAAHAAPAAPATPPPAPTAPAEPAAPAATPPAVPADHADHHGMHRDFKGAEEWAKVFDDPARDAWQRPEEVLSMLQVKPKMTVADVGAGTGYFVGRLSSKVGPAGFVIATDVEPDMIRYLDQRATRESWPNVRAALVGAGDPGLGVATVDRILVVDVWHHVDDRRAYAAKLAAALRPGGVIAVVDFDKDAKHGPPPEHRLAPEIVIEELRSAGLTAKLAKEKLPEQYVVIARAAQ
jgi:predicted methyltransferase